MSNQPASPRAAYHHGELAEKLMELAVVAIDAKGTEALSLRALAREAGVSATAPYRHFPSKRCLLAGVATRGFRQLTAAMAEDIKNHSDIDERFIAMGIAYVGFAVANPVPYQLMFGSVLADFSDYQMLQEAAEDSFQQLLGELQILIDHHDLQIEPIELAGVVWSGVHGMASLMITKSGQQQKLLASQPGQSIGSLHMNTDRAMRVLFGSLIGESAAIRD